MVQVFHRLALQTHLVYHQDGLRHISVHLVHQAIQLCRHMDTIHQVHHQHTLHRVQIINRPDQYQIIRQIAQTIHRLRRHMVIK